MKACAVLVFTSVLLVGCGYVIYSHTETPIGHVELFAGEGGALQMLMPVKVHTYGGLHDPIGASRQDYVWPVWMSFRRDGDSTYRLPEGARSSVCPEGMKSAHGTSPVRGAVVIGSTHVALELDEYACKSPGECKWVAHRLNGTYRIEHRDALPESAASRYFSRGLECRK